jgi:hypothetical protein
MENKIKQWNNSVKGKGEQRWTIGKRGRGETKNTVVGSS